MGYQTDYSLEVKPECLAAIRELRKVSDEAQCSLDADGSCSHGESRWYEHEKDMKALSLKYPMLLFTLRGSGEEVPDLWVKYFHKGRMQEAKAKITYDDFDIEKLV